MLDGVVEFDDWALAEIPLVLAMIGPAAPPHLKRFLPDQRNHVWARIGAAEAIGRIGRANPSCRAEVVEWLVEQLGRSRFGDPVFNGHVVSALLDVRAVEAIDAVAGAYEAGHGSALVCGSLADVLAELQTEVVSANTAGSRPG